MQYLRIPFTTPAVFVQPGKRAEHSINTETMLFRYLVFLTILILTIKQACGLNSGSNPDQDSDDGSNEGTPVPTKLYPLEKVLKQLSIPVEEIGNLSEIIKSNIDNFTSLISQESENTIGISLDSGESNDSDDVIDTLTKPLAIVPGTLWCGPGDIARNEEDLGLFKETDACCREHDNCPDNIITGDTKHGLLNNGIFTRSHCSCDHKFYNCLKTANSSIAVRLGTTYFNILTPQCYKKDNVIRGCKKHSRYIPGKCVKYKLDDNGEKEVQWFDDPDF